MGRVVMTTREFTATVHVRTGSVFGPKGKSGGGFVHRYMLWGRGATRSSKITNIQHREKTEKSKNHRSPYKAWGAYLFSGKERKSTLKERNAIMFLHHSGEAT